MELKATSYECHGPSAVITLSRPDRGNAWTGRLHAEYKHLVAKADQDDEIRIIIVTGAGWAFCVGGDAEALAGHARRGDYDDGLAAAGYNPSATNPGGDTHPQFDHELAFHFGLSKPVIAAINGPAAGIGLALACFADLRFAVPGAKLTTAHGKLNLPAEYGLSWILPRHIGLTRAMDLLLTSRPFLTDEAEAMGLINRIVPNQDLLPETLAFADQLASTCSAGSLRATRHQVYIDQHRGIGDSVAHAKALLAAMMGHPDFAKGVAAMKAKQPPDY